MSDYFGYPFNIEASEKNDTPPQAYSVEKTEPLPEVSDGQLIIGLHHNSIRRAIVGDLQLPTSSEPELYRIGLQQFIGPLWSRLFDYWSQGYVYRESEQWEFDGLAVYAENNPKTRINANLYQQENKIKSTVYTVDEITKLVTDFHHLEGTGTLLGRVRYHSGNSYIFNNSLKYCYLDADTSQDWPEPTDHNLRRQRLLCEYWWIYNDTQTITPGVTEPWAYVYDARYESSGVANTAYGPFTIKLRNPQAAGISFIEYFDLIPWSPYNEDESFYSQQDPVLNMSVIYKPNISASNMLDILAGTRIAPKFRCGIEVFDINQNKLGDYYADIEAGATPKGTVVPWTKVTLSFVPKYNHNPAQLCIEVQDVKDNNCFHATIEVGASASSIHYSGLSETSQTGYIAYIRPFIFREYTSNTDLGNADIYIAKADVYEGSQTLYNLDLKQGRVCDTLYFGNDTGITSITGLGDNQAHAQIPHYLDPLDSNKDVLFATSQITHIRPSTGGAAGSGAPGDITRYSNLAELIDTFLTGVSGAYLSKTGDKVIYTAGAVTRSLLGFSGAWNKYLGTSEAFNFDVMFTNLTSVWSREATFDLGDNSLTTAQGSGAGYYIGPWVNGYSYGTITGSRTKYPQPYIEAYDKVYSQINPDGIVTPSNEHQAVIDLASIGVAYGPGDQLVGDHYTIRQYANLIADGASPNGLRKPRPIELRVLGRLIVGNLGPDTEENPFFRGTVIERGKVDGIRVGLHTHSGGEFGHQLSINAFNSSVLNRIFSSATVKTLTETLVTGANADTLHTHHVDSLEVGTPDTVGSPYVSSGHSHLDILYLDPSTLGAPAANGLGAFLTLDTLDKIPHKLIIYPSSQGSTIPNMQYSWKCEATLVSLFGGHPLYKYCIYGLLEVYTTTSVAGNKTLMANGLVGFGHVGSGVTDPTNASTDNSLASPIRVIKDGDNYDVEVRDVEYWIKSGWESAGAGGYMNDKTNFTDFPGSATNLRWTVEVYY